MTSLARQTPAPETDIALPTTRWENWKYTSLKPVEAHLLRTPDLSAARAVAAQAIPPLPPALQDNAGHLVLVDGILRDDLSRLPDGDIFSHESGFSESDADAQQPLLVLNARHASEAIVLSFAENTRLEKPLVIQHISTGTTNACPRIVIEAAPHSEAVVVELWQGQNGQAAQNTQNTTQGVNNIAFEVNVARHAVLHHYRWQDEAQSASHLATTTLTVDSEASYDSFVLTTGAALSRQDSTAHMIGEQIECRLNGVYLLAGHQHHDTTILIHHKQPHGRSNQTFKGVIDDSARAVFQGKVFVHRGAQKTDGYQLNNALLLSDKAEVDVKPELEIYADDVKCSHGATTGQIDTAPLFYLRTRGLDEAQARLLLMQAFIGPALEEIRSELVRGVFSEVALDWLRARAG